MRRVAERILIWSIGDHETAEGLLGDLYEESSEPPSTLLLLSLALRYLATPVSRRPRKKSARAIGLSQDVALAFAASCARQAFPPRRS